jgi:secreted trypsin-like serine protease
MHADPVLVRNSRALIADRTRILGGEPTAEFPDCVAVGAPDHWCCSGTLVAPTLVVTAAHCAPGCVSRVFVGTDVGNPDNGRVINVQAAHVRTDYQPETHHNDLTVLVLEEPIIDVPPRGIASSADLADAKFVRLAGFGKTNVQATEGSGQKRAVDVPIASPKPEWGVREDIEFAAGAPLLDKDSCRGDSGGPAYVAKGSGYLLAGATSRVTQIVDNVRLCGDGGIYTRVHAFQEWIFGFAD